MAGADLDDDDGINAINITPMVDIMLVLLVIFMVTTTTINQIEGMQVDKPDAKTGKTLDELPEHMLLVCREDGTILADGNVLDGDAAIAAYIKGKVDENADVQGVVQCDEQARVGGMVGLIDMLRDNGVKRYAIATEKPKEDKPNG